MRISVNAPKADGDSLVEALKRLEHAESKFQGPIAPGVYAYGSHRPMGRIRSYSAAGLTPFAGRGMQHEFHLVGHIHVDDQGRVLRVEGFNGQEGERWAKQAHEKLKTSSGLAEGATVEPTKALRGCAHTGIR